MVLLARIYYPEGYETAWIALGEKDVLGRGILDIAVLHTRHDLPAAICRIHCHQTAGNSICSKSILIVKPLLFNFSPIAREN